MSERNGDKGLGFRSASGQEAKLLQGRYKEPTMQAKEPQPIVPWRMLESDEEAGEDAAEEGSS